MTHSLAADGDGLEKHYDSLLIQRYFPSYEAFWRDYIIPLTLRPHGIHLKTDAQLAADGKGPEEICNAQLHYSTLAHLGRAFQLRQYPQFSTDHLIFSLSSIVGAQDVAFELLQRFANPGKYGPWLGTGTGGIKGGREAQRDWKKANAHPLSHIRMYRNHLVHGRIAPSIGGQLPKIGKENSYFDWRLVTAVPVGSLPTQDFTTVTAIHDQAFNETVTYFETQWASQLIPNI